MVSKLEVKDLIVSIEGKKILDKLSFVLKEGEVCVLMGPNGAGKSTILNSIMANPKYELCGGDILLGGKSLIDEDANERAKKGIFMSFQHPVEIDGVTMVNFLRTSYNSLKQTNIQLGDFMKLLNEKMQDLEFDSKFRGRFVNKGFSGGEKKRSEILQMLLFEPKFVLLDEIDSGLDIDGIKLVADAINKLKTENKTGFLIVTHYNKLLDYVKPDKVIVLKNGRIEKEGNIEIIDEIGKHGFK